MPIYVGEFCKLKIDFVFIKMLLNSLNIVLWYQLWPIKSKKCFNFRLNNYWF